MNVTEKNFQRQMKITIQMYNYHCSIEMALDITIVHTHATELIAPVTPVIPAMPQCW